MLGHNEAKSRIQRCHRCQEGDLEQSSSSSSSSRRIRSWRSSTSTRIKGESWCFKTWRRFRMQECSFIIVTPPNLPQVKYPLGTLSENLSPVKWLKIWLHFHPDAMWCAKMCTQWAFKTEKKDHFSLWSCNITSNILPPKMNLFSWFKTHYFLFLAQCKMVKVCIL